jgi:D-amino-acid dehydrogenase
MLYCVHDVRHGLRRAAAACGAFPVMKVLVLGSGVIGTTCAWYLARAGHEVTVLDRQAEPAAETSFANGGQVSWSAASPWAAPDTPRRVLAWLLHPARAPFVLRPRLEPALWGWLVRALGECLPARYARNKAHMLRLGRYSHACLRELRAQTAFHYDERARGTLVVFRTAREVEQAERDTRLLERLGIDFRPLDAAGCLEIEPGLAAAAAAGRLAGGLHFPGDESGDCRRFTQALARHASEALGVVFEGGVTVQGLEREGARITAAITDRGPRRAQAYIVACGSYSPLILRPLGIRLPVYPVKGYSVTLPVTDESAAPAGTLTDETYKVVITRLGTRVRAAGTAELAGYDTALRAKRIETVLASLRELFPHGADFTRVEPWAGLRPMTPDNLPVLGATPYENLFLNTGHGTLGWTLACGSGRILADLVSGRTPEIDLEGLTLARFS